MKQNAYLMPQSDHWFIENILSILASRLHGSHNDSLEVKRGLLRVIFAMQRLPHFTEGISISLEVENYQIEINDEKFSFSYFTDDGHEMLRCKYFECSYQCFIGLDDLDNDEKKNALEIHLEALESCMLEIDILSIEDYSEGAVVDSPPTNPVWDDTFDKVFVVKDD